MVGDVDDSSPFRGVHELSPCARCGNPWDEVSCETCRATDEKSRARDRATLYTLSVRDTWLAWLGWVGGLSCAVALAGITLVPGHLIAKGHVAWWIYVVPAAIAIVAGLLVAALVSGLLLRKSARRIIAVYGGQLEILDGAGRVLFAALLAEARPTLAAYWQPVSNRRFIYPVLLFDRHGSSTFAVYDPDSKRLSEGSAECLPRSKRPRFSVDPTTWETLLAHFEIVPSEVLRDAERAEAATKARERTARRGARRSR